MSDLPYLCAEAVLLLKQHPALVTLAEEGILGFDRDGMWIFYGNEDNKPWRDPQGTGTSAIVLSTDDTWGSNAHNTAQFPVLQVLIYSDATRGVDNKPVRTDQKTKAWRIYDEIDKIFHDSSNTLHSVGSVRVHSSQRRYGPSVRAVPDTAGMVRLDVTYEIAVA